MPSHQTTKQTASGLDAVGSDIQPGAVIHIEGWINEPEWLNGFGRPGSASGVPFEVLARDGEWLHVRACDLDGRFDETRIRAQDIECRHCAPGYYASCKASGERRAREKAQREKRVERAGGGRDCAAAWFALGIVAGAFVSGIFAGMLLERVLS